MAITVQGQCVIASVFSHVPPRQTPQPLGKTLGAQVVPKRPSLARHSIRETLIPSDALDSLAPSDKRFSEAGAVDS